KLALDIEVLDLTVSASAINTLVGKTSVTVDATAATVVQGSLSDLQTMVGHLEGATPEANMTGTFHIELSDATISAEELKQADVENGVGEVRAAANVVVTGAAVDVAEVVSDSTIILPPSAKFTISDETDGATPPVVQPTSSTHLTTIANMASLAADAVNVDGVTMVSGSAASLAGLKDLGALKSGTYSATVNNGVNDDDASVTQVEDIKGATSGVVSATVTDTDPAVLVNLDTVTGENDLLNITVGAHDVTTDQLAKIEGATSDTKPVDVTLITLLTGDDAGVDAALKNTGLDFAADVEVAIQMPNAGSGVIDAAKLVSIQGNIDTGQIDVTHGDNSAVEGKALDITTAWTSVPSNAIAINVTDSVNVATFKAIDALTNGAVTATVSSNDIAELLTIGDSVVNVVTLSLEDTSSTPIEFTATELTDLVGKTTLGIKADGANGISIAKGKASEIKNLDAVLQVPGSDPIASGKIGVNSDFGYRVTDSTLDLDTLNGDISVAQGTVDILDATEITVASSLMEDIVNPALDTGIVYSATADLVYSDAPGAYTAADLLAAAATVADVDATVFTKLTGTNDDLQLIVDEVTAATPTMSINGTQMGFEVTAHPTTGAGLSVLTANALNALVMGTGVVVGSITDASDELAKIEGTGNTYTITVSNATASADDLLAVKGVSTVEVDADGVTRLNGTLDKVLLVKAEADATLSLAGLEGAQGSVVLSDSTIPSISDLLDVVSYVGGYVRATNVTSIEGSPGDIANLTAAVTAKDLLIGQVALVVSEVGVTEITATALNNVVPDLPGVTVDAKAYSTIRGSDADIAKIITDGVITLKENFKVVLTNTNDADAAKINTIIDASASGAIDFTNVTKITGLGEDVGDIIDLVGIRVTNFGTVDVVLSDTDTIDAKAL
ncbi:hypothetical protein N9H24_03970, partial [Planktomarina temperata]|nr:hypothetical protein [Planktomarina temperata]